MREVNEKEFFENVRGNYKRELISKCEEILLQEECILDVQICYNNEDDILNFWVLYSDLLYYKEDIELRDLIDLYYSDNLVDHFTEMLGNDDIEIGTISRELYFLIKYIEDSEILRDLIDLYYSDNLVDHFTEMLGNDDIEIGTISRELYFLIKYIEDSEIEDLLIDKMDMLLMRENDVIADLRELLNYTIECDSMVIETKLEVATIDFNKEEIRVLELESEEIFNY